MLEELRKIPEFNAFEQAIKEKLTKDNEYVRHFMPEVGEDYEDDGFENGKRQWRKFNITEDRAEEIGIDNLINDDTGYFSELVCVELEDKLMPFIQVLVTEIMK